MLDCSADHGDDGAHDGRGCKSAYAAYEILMMTMVPETTLLATHTAMAATVMMAPHNGSDHIGESASGSIIQLGAESQWFERQSRRSNCGW